MSKPIYILAGPNLNLLGTREPEIYGTDTLDVIYERLKPLAGEHRLVTRQTNHEGELVNWVQEAANEASALILNAAAYTHTSVALLDALKSCDIPKIEVHLSNPAARESFRQTNFVSPAVTASIAGLGALGYEFALRSALTLISQGET